MQNPTSNHINQRDEIDLLELFSNLWENKGLLVKYCTIGALAMFALNFFLPKMYLSEATFFHRADGVPTTAFGSYSSLLGDMNSTLENQIEEIILSASMALNLAEAVDEKFPGYFDETLTLNEKAAQLKLDKKLRIDKNKRSLFRLKYSSPDPRISLFIINRTIKDVNTFNETLELSEQSKIITILDHPELPLKPHSPKKLLNILVAIFLSFLTGLLAIFIKKLKQ